MVSARETSDSGPDTGRSAGRSGASATPDLSVVIVNWNGRKLLLECLESLRAAELALDHEVIVVDNGSSDGSVDAVARAFPDARVVALERNLGFAGGTNRGLAQMRGRHAVLLNNDTLIPRGSFEACVDYLDRHPDCGVVGPELRNPDGSRQNCIHNYPTLPSELVGQSLLRRLLPRRYPSRLRAYAAPLDVQAVLGACLFVRRPVVEQVGPLDEDYFFFLEDTDWCYRIRRAGWRVVHLPQVHVVHLHGESSKRRQPLRTRIEYHRSRHLFFRKHRGPVACWALQALVLARLALGSALGGRRAPEYRSILRWHLRGRPAGEGLART